MTIKIKRFFLCVTFVSSTLMSALTWAQNSVFEVGEAVLPAITPATATTPFTFTRINFASAFPMGTTPNVFAMTPEFGAGAADDPCTIRIRNVDNTGFDAACLEPFNEDRSSPGLTFEYIAIQDGSLTVPLVGGGGSVRFESACQDITSQQFGPNCANCTLNPGQSQGFTTINFAPPTPADAFSSAPALLTQMQSTTNILTGALADPEFLDVAVRTNSLNANRFDVAIERMEAGNGTALNSGENICYLAVERNGCQNLDFSSFDGPSSVTFEAVFGGNVDGHDNGNTSGEGATFAAACFSNTPIALAKQRERRGNNGGFLRRASVNSTEIILTYDEDRVSDGERSHIDEAVSVLAFSSTFTTPVTLSKAKVTQLGRRTIFEWETSAETFHLGFHLWGETNNGWVQLNRRLITGQGIDTDITSQYRHAVRLSRSQYNEIQRFGISSVDSTGFEEFYGPFEVGAEYGEEANTETVDWTQTRQQFEQTMRQRGYKKVRNRWRRVSSRLQKRIEHRERRINRTIFDLHFDTPGIYRVSGSELLALNPRWNGLPLTRIALTLNGKAMPRHIISDDERLDANDQIVFYVKAPTGTDAVYLNNYVYQLRTDSSRAIDAGNAFTEVFEHDTVEDHALISVVATQRNAYSATLKTGEPWYDSRLLAIGRAASKSYTVDFAQAINPDKEGELSVQLFGGIDLPGDTQDHHVQIFVNGELVDDAVFDGLNTFEKTITLAPGVLKQSDNIITVTAPGDTGLFADLILIDELVLSAQAALSGQASYDFVADPEVAAYQFELSPSTNAPQAYAYTESGALSFVPVVVNEGMTQFAALPYQASHLNAVELHYAIAAKDAWPQPSSIELTHGKQLHTQASDYLVVAHPTFIGTELDQFVQLKTDQGYQPRVINWLDLVANYGFGNDTPAALNTFLQRAGEYFKPDNILLVGGHTYDYLGILNDDVVNFIPTHYREVGIFQYAPSDNVYADLDNDHRPDLAIGRWPVRSIADLQAIVQKTQDWHNNRAASPYQNAMLVAQQNDNRNLDFAKQLNGRIALPLAELENVEDIEKLYMQDLVDAGTNDSINVARQRIADALNDGLELLSFAGHGSTAAWGFQGIANTDFVKTLNNHGKPTVVMPLACYTTNYESPSVNTLAHQWLFAGTQGAAAIHGASVLGEYRENGVFAERYLRNVASSNTIGQAIMKAKNEMSSANQMLHNWALLGDPALPLR